MRVQARSAGDTEDLGGRLARARAADDDALAVIYLSGELGAGKTTFTRGFLRALGVNDPVRSPTYNLLELYPLGSLTVVHVDLYRVQAPSELDALGLREWASTGHVWLIEWPERGAGRLPPADVAIDFAIEADRHDVELRAYSPRGIAWLATLEAGRLEKQPHAP